MRRAIAWIKFVVCVAWLSVSTAYAQAIPEETLNRLKAATVFIRCGSDPVQTGSGFLLERTPTMGLIVTNAHVVQRNGKTLPIVQCVFNSGLKTEFTVPALAVGVDAELDLAVLQVQRAQLPEVIESTNSTAVRETQPVFILGFPFGEALSTSKRNAALTISRGAISSVRRDENDNPSILQVDGGINPGNSGGPVVTESGTLVGISVAKVSGTEIGFAIPKHFLSAMFRGRVESARITSTGAAAVPKWDIEVKLIDPKQQIREVTVLTILKARAASARPGPDGTWQAAAPDMKAHPLVMAAGAALGRIELESPSTLHSFQIKCTRLDGTETYTKPEDLKRTSLGAKPLAEGGSPSNPLLPGPTSYGESAVVVDFPELITNVALGGGGRYLILHLGAKSEAIVYDLEKREKAATMDAPEDAVIAAGMDKLFIVTPFDNGYSRWSLSTLKNEKSGTFQFKGAIKTISMGHASKGPLLVLSTSGLAKENSAFFSIVDPATLRVTMLSSPSRTPPPGFPRHREAHEKIYLRAAANGTAFGVMGSAIVGTEILFPTRKPISISDNKSVGHICPTPDGQAICTTAGFISSDLVRKRGNYICFPTCSPQYFLALTEGGLEVRDTKNAQVQYSFPPLPEFSVREAGSRRGKLAFDQRIHVMPSLKLLVTIPQSDDKIVLRELALSSETALASKDDKDKSAKNAVARNDPGGAAPHPTKEPERTWTDTSGKFRVTARFVELKDGKVTLVKDDGQRLTVSLDRLSPADNDYAQKAASRTSSELP